MAMFSYEAVLRSVGIIGGDIPETPVGVLIFCK